MSNIYLLFICIVVPIFMMTFFVDVRSKIFVIYMCLGCLVCLLAGELNAAVSELLPERDLYYLTVNVTPIVEELLKAVPVLAFALFISDERRTLINISMVTGIGFAILENTYLLLNAENPSLLWALVRALGAGFMHGLSTLFVGFGLSYIRQKKAFLYPGIVGLLVTAVIFHSTYNAFVQSEFAYLGYFFPMVIFAFVKIVKHFLAKEMNLCQSSTTDLQSTPEGREDAETDCTVSDPGRT